MSWKWVAALAIVGGGVFVATRAFAKEPGTDDKPDPKPDPQTPKGVERKIRHGIAYEGCAHFELVDQEAVKSWGQSNPLVLLKWLPKLDEVRENPEPMLLELWDKLFPECTWPPPASTTFGSQRGTWADSIEEFKGMLAQFQAASMGGSGAGDALIMALARAFGGAA